MRIYSPSRRSLIEIASKVLRKRNGRHKPGALRRAVRAAERSTCCEAHVIDKMATSLFFDKIAR